MQRSLFRLNVNGNRSSSETNDQMNNEHISLCLRDFGWSSNGCQLKILTDVRKPRQLVVIVVLVKLSKKLMPLLISTQLTS